MEETQLPQGYGREILWHIASSGRGTSISVSCWPNIPGSQKAREQENAVPHETEQGRKGRDGPGNKLVYMTAFTWPKPVCTPRQLTALNMGAVTPSAPSIPLDTD